MKIIRSGTFETNSSSTHSFTLSQDYDTVQDKYIGKTFIFKLNYWGYDEFTKKLTKILEYILSKGVKFLESFCDFLFDKYQITIELPKREVLDDFYYFNEEEAEICYYKQMKFSDMAAFIFNDNNTFEEEWEEY